MEAKQFAELMKSPMQVAQLPADALRELVSRYPFSASLQMLLLKQYQLNDHPAYDEQLAKSAIYAPDRRALYRLVQLRETPPKEATPLPIEPQVLEPEMELEQELENETDVVPETWVAEPITDEPTVLDTEPISFAELEKQIVDEEPLFTEEEIINIETATPPYGEVPELVVSIAENDTETVIQDVAVTDDDYEAEIPRANEAVSFLPPIIPMEHFQGWMENEQNEENEGEEELTGEEMLLEPQADDEQEPTEERTGNNVDLLGNEYEAEANDEPETVEVANEAEVVEESLVEETVQEEVVVEVEVTQEDDTTPIESVEQVEEEATSAPQPATNVILSPSTALRTGSDDGRNSQLVTDSFAGWLQRVKRHEIPTAAAPPDEHDFQEKAALDALFGAGTYEATLVQESISLPEEEAAPKVVPTREQLMEPDEMANRKMDEQAKKSLSMDNDLVTETLARIYEIQKKTGKAIEAYEVLKLRYPEKAAQYNAKIQALREI